MDDNISGASVVIDARNLACPLPVLKLRKALRAVSNDVLVELRATDPAAVRDVPAFCAAQGHTVLELRRDGAVIRFLIRRGSDTAGQP